MALTVTISGNKYPVRFGYSAIRALGYAWDKPGIMEVYQHVMKKMLPADDSKEATEEEIGLKMLSFDNVEMMAAVFLAGIENAAGDDFDGLPTAEEIASDLLKDIGMITDVFAAFVATIPKPKDKNPEPKTEGGKKQKAKKK